MKTDAICIDKAGIRAEVLVDLDYVSDADELKTWIEQELNSWKLSEDGDAKFDLGDYAVTNWDELVAEVETSTDDEDDSTEEAL